MSIESVLEVESKFAVGEIVSVPDFTRLEQVSGLGEGRDQALSAIYYDTEDLRLTRSKITLRRRTGGPDDGWHIKLPAEQGRLELRHELSEPVDGQYQVPEELLAQVRSLVRTRPLKPIAQIDNNRTETTLSGEDGAAVAEFSDDSVTAWSLLPGGTRTEWREWEMELADNLAGTEAGTRFLHDAATLLIGAGARVSASPAKLHTALGDSTENAPLPNFLVYPDVEDDSPAAAVISALSDNRDKLLAYDPKVRRDEWDSVHQMRVATRELRSHMETFNGIIGGETVERIENELKILARILGQARDAEVVEERFLDLLDSEDSGVLDEHTREHLREDMGAEYRRAHGYVIASLNSERYLGLLDDIDQLLADPPVAVASAESDDEPDAEQAEEPADVETVLSQHLDGAYSKLLKRHTKAVDNWGNSELSLHEREDYFHDMRKTAKKLRYAAEAIGKATDLKTKRLYSACKDLQSSLGDFQDAVTSRDKLLHMSKAAHRRGESTFGYGLLYQRERGVGLEALEEYAAGVKRIRNAYERLTRKRKKK